MPLHDAVRASHSVPLGDSVSGVTGSATAISKCGQIYDDGVQEVRSLYVLLLMCRETARHRWRRMYLVLLFRRAIKTIINVGRELKYDDGVEELHDGVQERRNLHILG